MTGRDAKGWNRRWALGGGLGAALGLGYWAFGRPGGTGFSWSKASPRILQRGNSAEPATLDPHKSANSWEDWIIGDLMVGLMHHDAAGNPIPCACESYSASADGLTFTIKLREHDWSDGMPVTADDYVFSLRRIGDPKTASQYVSILYFIKNMQQAAEGKVKPEEIGARAIDRHTLEIQVLYQVPYIDQLLMHATLYAAPRHVVEKYGDDWTNPGNYVSNGPFILKDWVPNDHVRVVKNPRFYAADTVHFDEIYYYPTEDSASTLKRFRAGELDLANRCPSYGEVPVLRKIIPRELRITPVVSNYWLPVNHLRKPFDDVRVRQALAMAIDRETLVNKVLRIGQTPAYTYVPPGMPDYPYTAYARFRDMPLPARIEKAKALLAEAGYGPGNPLSFDLTMYNAVEFRLIAITLQAMWHEAGVNMKPAAVDSQILYDMMRKKDFDVATAGWIADYRDPRNYLSLFLTSSTDLNYGSYSNPRYDQLVANSDFIHDAVERQKTMAEAEQILLDDAGVITLINDTTRDLVSPQVQNWISNPANFNRSRWLSLDRNDVRV
jgi:oligopeptide transport system substrate-binding protein